MWFNHHAKSCSLKKQLSSYPHSAQHDAGRVHRTVNEDILTWPTYSSRCWMADRVLFPWSTLVAFFHQGRWRGDWAEHSPPPLTFYNLSNLRIIAVSKVQEYFPKLDCAAASPETIFKFSDYGIQEYPFPTTKPVLVHVFGNCCSRAGLHWWAPFLRHLSDLCCIQDFKIK